MSIQRLSEGSLWRHGRSKVKGWNFEWGIFKSLSPGISFSVGERVGGYVSIGFAYVFLCYRGFRWFDEREFSLKYHDGAIWIYPWIVDDGAFSKSKPWYKRAIVLHLEDWVKGRIIFTEVRGEKIEIVVPMPEGSYVGAATPVHSEWRRSRWIGVKRWDGYDVEMATSIPFRGKGENGYDCGDDGLCGIHSEGTLEEVIGKTVATALKSRNRYGEISKTKGKIVYA